MYGCGLTIKSAEGDWSDSQEMFVLNSVNTYLYMNPYIEEMHHAVMCPKIQGLCMKCL